MSDQQKKVQTYEGALIKIANYPNCDRCQVAVDALAKVAKMSDHPKPTGELGMKDGKPYPPPMPVMCEDRPPDQPKPTGEWTGLTLSRLIKEKGYQGAADAHNAALDAAQDALKFYSEQENYVNDVLGMPDGHSSEVYGSSEINQDAGYKARLALMDDNKQGAADEKRCEWNEASKRLIHYIEGVLEEKGSFDWRDIARILKEEMSDQLKMRDDPQERDRIRNELNRLCDKQNAELTAAKNEGWNEGRIHERKCAAVAQQPLVDALRKILNTHSVLDIQDICDAELAKVKEVATATKVQ